MSCFCSEFAIIVKSVKSIKEVLKPYACNIVISTRMKVACVALGHVDEMIGWKVR